MSDDKEVAIRPPRLEVSEDDAKQIMDELGLNPVADHVSRPTEVKDLIRLGRFVEGSGVVALDHGAILLTRQVMLRHLMRLEAVAQDCERNITAGDEESFKRMKDLTYMIGYLGVNIGKLSTIGIKTKVAAEQAAEELKKNKQPTWVPGTMVQAQPGSTVNLNGVADKPPQG
jgi:hypothetical protein